MMGRPIRDRHNILERGVAEGGQPRRHRGRTRRAGAPRGRRWLAVAGFCTLALVCLSVAAISFVVLARPLDVLRERLVTEVENRTGRTLTVAGPMSISLYPRVLVALEGVAIAPPDGMAGGPLVTVPTLDVETSLWPLLARRPRLDRITLHRPTFDLVIDAQGRHSWDNASPRPRPTPTPSAGRTAADPSVPADARPKASARALGRGPLGIRVLDGTVRYRDDRSGTSYQIGALDIDVDADGADGRAQLSGALTWQGVPLRFAGTASPTLILKGEPGQVDLKLAGAPVEAAYEGTLGVRGGVSADGTLQVERLNYKDVKIGPARLAVSVHDGVAKLTIQDAKLYGGRANGSLLLDGTGPAPAVAANLNLTGLSMLPLLTDVAGTAWLDGRATLTLALNGQGRSERQIVETLQGQIKVSVADGALAGVDIDKAVRALQRGRLGDLALRPEDRTPFSEIAGTFDVANGVAKNQDLKLVSTHAELKGEGLIELTPRRIDYTLHTKISAGAPGRDAVVNIGTLEFPIAIKGRLERPKFTIKGQDGLTDALKQIGRNLRSREVQDALKGLLGGKSEKRVEPGELIEKPHKKE
jgi:uncharacterized protein involved in outer membrane biogenesis